MSKIKSASIAEVRHITREEYLKLLEHCPNQQWRTIIALARYGGLRCPSEMLRLRWSDIDWEQKRFCVYRSEKFLNGRSVPLFPDVKKELRALLEENGNPKSEFVVTQFTDRKNVSLYPQFGKIVRQAKLPRIRRPFGLMRLSRSTEIRNKFGFLCVCEWLGISAAPLGTEMFVQSVSEKEFQAAAAWLE